MAGDKLITYWDDCGNRGENCSLDGVFIVSPCWSPDVVMLLNGCSSGLHVYWNWNWTRELFYLFIFMMNNITLLSYLDFPLLFLVCDNP